MKPNVKVLYYILKFNGLAPFRINSERGIVEKTNGSFYHFVIFGAFLQAVTISASVLIFAVLSQYSNENMRVVVVKMEISAQAFKALMIFTLNVLYRNDIIQLINASISFKKETAPSQSFFDDILASQYTTRLVSFFVQFFITAFAFVTAVYTPGNAVFNFLWIVAMYSNFNVAMVSSTFVYGGLVTCSRFLRILNNNFELCVLSTKNGKNVDGTIISTETAILDLERFVIFFDKFTSITNKLYRVYGFHILIVLIVSAAFTLYELFISFDLLYRQPFLSQSVKESSREVIDTLSTITVNASELYFIIIGAHSIKTEVERSFRICFKYAVTENIDGSLRDAIDHLHVAIRNNRPHLLVMGLLQIEKSLFLSITATIVSFLTILIQFQLQCARCKTLVEVFEEPQVAWD